MLDDIYFQSQGDESQLPLFDAGSTAQATRSTAHNEAEKKQTARQLQILILLKEAGSAGLIRHELADKVPCTLSGICAPVLSLLRDQEIVEDGTRESKYGKQAAILKLPELAGSAE